VADPFIGRRAFLARAAALGAAAVLRPSTARAAPVRFTAYPFTLGVASGAPRSDSVVLWTRLAPSPLEGGGMAPGGVEVRWEIAEDEKFARIAVHGKLTTDDAKAHAVHAEAGGLAPARWYFYRFIAGGESSPVGRTRTAPLRGRGDERLRLVVASCQQFEQGYFAAHRHIAAEDADLVAFVGDYIYESSWGREHVRKHSAGEPRTLADYRDRYGQYKSDADLRLSHAAAPWIVTWDDHEVDNDYANDRSEDLDPDFLARRAAAYRAFFEHMPLRASALLEGGGMRIYDRFEWGSLATIHVLDDRQYRSYQACPKASRGGSNTVGPECTERLDPQATLLGAEQERWLDAGLARSQARWNLIAQQTLFVPSGRPAKRGLVHWTDGWDGYPAARERLLRSLVAGRAANPVLLGGDVHATITADVHAQPERPDSPVVATECCVTSITSQGMSAGQMRAIAEANPHIRYANSESRGYAVIELSSARMQARLRALDTPKRADAGVATLSTSVVEAGRPGLAR
jgi:alkaline phosphatase D